MLFTVILICTLYFSEGTVHQDYACNAQPIFSSGFEAGKLILWKRQ